jgi:hypothetical protein
MALENIYHSQLKGTVARCLFLSQLLVHTLFGCTHQCPVVLRKRKDRGYMHPPAAAMLGGSGYIFGKGMVQRKPCKDVAANHASSPTFAKA